MAKIQLQIHTTPELRCASCEYDKTEEEIIKSEISDVLRGDKLAFIFNTPEGGSIVIPSEVLRKSIIHIVNL